MDDDSQLRISKGVFRWNTVDAKVSSEDGSSRFELGELSICFPEGQVRAAASVAHVDAMYRSAHHSSRSQLTVISGQVGAGKVCAIGRPLDGSVLTSLLIF